MIINHPPSEDALADVHAQLDALIGMNDPVPFRVTSAVEREFTTVARRVLAPGAARKRAWRARRAS